MGSDRLTAGREYIESARAEGTSDEEIRLSLLEMGWSAEDIHALSRNLPPPLITAFPAPPPSPPPPSPEVPLVPVKTAGDRYWCPGCGARVFSADDHCMDCGARLDAGRAVSTPPERDETVDRARRPRAGRFDRLEVEPDKPPEEPAPPTAPPEPVKPPPPVAPREPRLRKPERPAPTPPIERPAPRAPLVPEPAKPEPEPVPPPAEPAPPQRPRRGIEVTIGTAWLTREWITITKQMIVVTVIIAGIAIMAAGEFAHRRGYVIQSQALTGGGAAVVYLALFAGQHLYQFLDSKMMFPAMAAVTVFAAAQAIRHKSETVATFAWITGYAVPFLIGSGSGAGSGGPGPLFTYLTLLSIAVFVVAQRHAWPTFTGLALMGAYASCAYIFRVSDGALGWTLTYLMLVTAGMLWVSMSRKGRAGENFGAIGAVAGYLVTGVVMLVAMNSGVGGSPEERVFVPYMYLLVLSGVTLWMGHMQDWRSLRWLGALGSFVGFLLLFPMVKDAGVAQMGNWMLLYAAMSVAGSLAVSASKHSDAEPLAISAVTTAYAAAALLTWASLAGAPSDGAMFWYLIALAAGVLLVTMRFEWTNFSALGLVAAFLATVLLYDRLPEIGPTSHYPLMYLAMLGAGALGVSAYQQQRTLGAISVVGVFAALPLTGMMGASVSAFVVPVYLALAAVAALATIEWQRSYGLEWVALLGTWGLYFIWRVVGGIDADPASLGFTSVYLLAFLAAMWVRHGLRGADAGTHDSILACANVGACFALGCWDLHEIEGPGLLALGLFALYLATGVAAIRRRPAQVCFGPVLVGIGIFFLTLAIPLLFHGYHITVLWALEATVLMGISFYLRAPALRSGSLLVLMLALLKAIVMDSGISPDTYQVLLNGHALSMLAVIAAMYIGAYWYAHFREQVREKEQRDGSVLIALATGLLLWITSSEAWCLVGWQLGMDKAAQYFALSGVWVVFGAVLMVVGAARDRSSLRWAGLGLFAATIIKVLAIDLSRLEYQPLINAHAAPLLAITAVLYAAGAWYATAKDEGDSERDVGTAAVTVATGLLLWITSWETWLFVGSWLHLDRAAQHFALSGVWVVFAAVLMVVGIVRDRSSLRWAGLSLFAATIVKVFGIDWSLEEWRYIPLVHARAAPLIAITAALYAVGDWYARTKDADDPERDVGKGVTVVATGLLLWITSSETWLFVGWRGGDEPAQHFALSGVWVVFGAVLMALGAARDSVALRWTGLGLLGVTVLKVFTGEQYQTSEAYLPLVNAHAAPLLVIVALLFALGAWLARTKNAGDSERDVGTGVVVVAIGLLLWVASSEAWHSTGLTLSYGEEAQWFALSAVWVVFGAVLLGLGVARDNAAQRWAGLALFAVTTIKIFAKDLSLLEEPSYVLLLNPHAGPLLVITVLLYLAAAWYARKGDTDDPERTTGSALVIAATGLLLWIASSEVCRYLDWRTGAGLAGQQMGLSMVWVIFGATMVVMGLQRNSAGLRWLGFVALVVTAGKVLWVDENLTQSNYRLLANHHAFPLLIIVAMLYLASHWYRRNLESVGEDEEMAAAAIPYVASLLLLWVLSIEALRFTEWQLGAGEDAALYALSAVWTVYGAVLVAFGLLRRNAPIRWIGMGLLAITILKVFLWDMSELDPIWRILAFLGLGVVLIAVGFGYQRLVRELEEDDDAGS